jgi:DNA repair protein RecO (recombination protein O)
MSLAFLLHSRTYKENSALQIFFSESAGRIDLVSRSVRRSRKQMTTNPVLFAAYDVSWSGNHELKLLKYCEAVSPGFSLSGRSLFCGLYLNELLYRLLPGGVPEPSLFVAYQKALILLAQGVDEEVPLRRFELSLLASLGYGICLVRDVRGAAIEPVLRYHYVPEHGLENIPIERVTPLPAGLGADFMAIAAEDYACLKTRQLAKVLMRKALAVHLGSRPLNSRALFMPVDEKPAQPFVSGTPS